MVDINILTFFYSLIILMLLLTLISFVFTAEYKLQKLRYSILVYSIHDSQGVIQPENIFDLSVSKLWCFIFSLCCLITYSFIVIKGKDIKILLLFWEVIGLVCVILSAPLQFIIIQTMSRVPDIYRVEWENLFVYGFIGSLRLILSITILCVIFNALFLLYVPKGQNISGYFVAYIFVIFILIGFFYICIPLIFTDCPEYFSYLW